MTKHIRTVRITKLKIAWMLALATTILGAGAAQSRTLPEQPDLETLVAQIRADIHRIRQIGWRQDRSAVPELVQILEISIDAKDHPVNRYRLKPPLPWSASYLVHLRVATIVALGRVGDPRALPVLEKILSSDPFHPLDASRVDSKVLEKVVSSKPEANWSLLPLTPFVEVAVARIKAEQAVPRANTLAKWQEQVQHFLDAVGMSLPEMVQHLADENKPRHPNAHNSPPSRARVALRALAEMAAEAYREGCHGSFEWLERAGIAWDADIGAWLTVELAKRPLEQRLRWLMDEMRTKTVLTAADSYLSQAIADLGNYAVPALEKWLRELWAVRATETRNPDETYTRTDNMTEEAYWILSATGSDAALQVLKAQYEQCRRAGEESLEALLARVLREMSWVFVSDW